MLVAGAATGALWAASDPLVGKWKVNSSKSKLTDEMKVEAVGANKYAVTFGPGSVDTIVADGTDQPALQGTTLSITVDGPNNWKVVRKRDGRTLVMGIWTLSADGKSLDDDFTAYQRDGSTTKLHYVYGRTAGSSGFTGTWDSMTAEVNASRLAVPRSGSLTTSTAMSSVTNASGKTPRVNERMRSPLAVSAEARYRTRASFANSEGSNENGPSPIQRRAPPTYTPTCGTKTRSSESTHAPRKSGATLRSCR